MSLLQAIVIIAWIPSTAAPKVNFAFRTSTVASPVEILLTQS